MNASKAKFKVLNTDLRGQEFELEPETASIGRGPDNAITLDQVSVSRKHAQLSVVEGGFQIVDLGSRNGMKINGTFAKQGTLTDGCVLTIGDVQLQFTQAAGSVAAELAAEPAADRTIDMPAEALAEAQKATEPTAAPLVPASQAGRPLSAEDLAGAAQAQAESAPPAAAPSQVPFQVQPDEVGMETGPSPKPNYALFGLVGIGLLAVIGGFLALRSGGPSGPRVRWISVLLKEGETRVVSTAQLDANTVHIADETIVAAEVDASVVSLLIVYGITTGETDVTIRTFRGNLLKVRAIVRGRLEEDEEVRRRRSDLNDAQIVGLAKQFVQQGDSVRRENQYEAIKHYRRAVKLLKRLPIKPEINLVAMERIDQTEEMLEKEWDGMRSEYGLAIKNKDFAGAEDVLRKMLAFVPDKNDPRHQKAAIFLRRIEKQRGD